MANDSLFELRFKCTYASGTCVNYEKNDPGQSFVSQNVDVQPSPRTKLSAALFDQNVGYAVTYQDIHGSLKQVTYANTTHNGLVSWQAGQLVSNLNVTAGLGLATSYVLPINGTGWRETVYQVVGSSIVPMSASTSNLTNSIIDHKYWSQSEFSHTHLTVILVHKSDTHPEPSTDILPNFSPANGSIASVPYGAWDCIFYIDSTRQLQFIRSTDSGASWAVQPPMDSSQWPQADAPNAPIAAATSGNATNRLASIFYTSGAKVVEVQLANSEWKPFSYVEPVKSRRLLKAVKIGAATGAATAFLLVVAVTFFCIQRRRAAALQNSSIQREDSIFEYTGSDAEAAYAGKAELGGQPVVVSELDHDPECLLLHQLQARRLFEAAGKEVERGEMDGEAWRREMDAGWAGRELDVDECNCRCELDARVVCELPSPGLEQDVEKAGGLVVGERARRSSDTGSSGDVDGSQTSKSREEESEKTEKKLPGWSWAILKRQKEELEVEEKGKGDA